MAKSVLEAIQSANGTLNLRMKRPCLIQQTLFPEVKKS